MAWLDLSAEIAEEFEPLVRGGVERFFGDGRVSTISIDEMNRWARGKAWDAHQRRAAFREATGVKRGRPRKEHPEAALPQPIGCCKTCGLVVVAPWTRTTPPQFCSRRCQSADDYRRHTAAIETSGKASRYAFRHKGIDWDSMPLGQMSDREIARLAKCTAHSVASARKWRRIPAFPRRAA